MAKQETENSEDPGYIRQVEEASQNMTSTIQPMVESAKSLAKNITHPGLIADWRKNNNAVSHFIYFTNKHAYVLSNLGNFLAFIIQINCIALKVYKKFKILYDKK